MQGNNAVFKVRINEKGTRFNEKIKINERENTVSFAVPEHNDVERSEVLNEFNLVNKFYAVILPKLSCAIYILTLDY